MSSQLSELSKQQNIPKKEGPNFTLVDPGSFSDLFQYEIKHPLREKPVSGKLFLKDHLKLTGMQISYGILPAGISIPFNHRHKQNEELYLIISGAGQIQVDGEIMDVQEGAAVRIAPNGERCLRNNSDKPLVYIVIQAKENSLSQDTFDDGVPGERPVSW
jgi:mannose-6-phosphate isomerase-like protein (cupin superfamily)